MQLVLDFDSNSIVENNLQTKCIVHIQRNSVAARIISINVTTPEVPYYNCKVQNLHSIHP